MHIANLMCDGAREGVMADTSMLRDILIGGVLVLAIAVARPGLPSHAAGTPSVLVDGYYQGRVEPLPNAASDGCADGGPMAVQVNGGHFQLPWRSDVMFEVDVDPRGVFEATLGGHNTMTTPSLRGHIDLGRINAEFGTARCGYRFTATRI